MRYLKKYKESFDNGEDNIDFIITKIKEKYPKVKDKAGITSFKIEDLLDMICWFEENFKRIDDKDEDAVLNQLREEYNL
jgi:hypothetical protein